MISIYNHVGTVDVLGDVQGYFTADSTAFQFTPISPFRVLNTSAGTGVQPAGPIGPNSSIAVSMAPAPADAEAVVLNVTAVSPTDGGYLAVYPDSPTLPAVSNLNYSAGEIIANAAIVPTNNNLVDFYNHVGSVNVDAGYFEG
jgi:hypothetical protein